MRWGGSRMSRGVGSHFISPDDVVGVTYVGMVNARPKQELPD
jgi:hypothetical protein